MKGEEIANTPPQRERQQGKKSRPPQTPKKKLSPPVGGEIVGGVGGLEMGRGRGKKKGGGEGRGELISKRQNTCQKAWKTRSPTQKKSPLRKKENLKRSASRTSE